MRFIKYCGNTFFKLVSLVFLSIFYYTLFSAYKGLYHTSLTDFIFFFYSIFYVWIALSSNAISYLLCNFRTCRHSIRFFRSEWVKTTSQILQNAWFWFNFLKKCHIFDFIFFYPYVILFNFLIFILYPISYSSLSLLDGL